MKITRNHFAIGVLLIGSLQMLGHLVGSKPIRGLGIASGISPFPRVFCETDGYESFAATYHLEWNDDSGARISKQLTPEWYAKLEGPYNRRNVYGAAIAFAPLMDENLRDAVLTYATAPESALRKELAVPDHATRLTIRIMPREGEKTDHYLFEMP